MAETDVSTLTTDLIAQMWRDHSGCNWVSDGVNVRWSCGIIHPGALHMQPTTRGRHFAALLMTQVEAERVLVRSSVYQRLLAAIERRRTEATP